MDSYCSQEELDAFGFISVGKNVRLSRKASIYSPENISLGSNVRIDDFCILSGNIQIENNIHVAAYSALFGGDAGIRICNYANISSRVCVYAISDDYSGKSMTNPTIPDKFKDVIHAPVKICEHCIIGSGSTVLPGVTIQAGTAIGAMSLVKSDTQQWYIYAGIPARKLKERKKNLLLFVKEYENESD